MQKLSRMLIIAGVIIICMATLVFADDEIIEKVAKGSIDWTNGFIIATGFGISPEDVTNRAQARLMAERAALSVAYRNLLEVAEGVTVDAETIVENFMLKSDIVKTKVEGFVKGATIIPDPKTGEDYTYSPDGTVSVTIRAALDGRGGLADVIFPSTMREKPLADEEETEKGDVYTGLIIDASKIKVKPALAPKILDENGREVYGTGFVSRQYAVEHGIVGYAKDLKAAKKNERVTNNPVVSKGIKATGANGANIVIKNSDAQKILGMSESLSFLDKCRVLIVVR